MSCEILYGLISNSMQTSLAYLGTVLECTLQKSCQATLEASFSQFLKIKDQEISLSVNTVKALTVRIEKNYDFHFLPHLTNFFSQV